MKSSGEPDARYRAAVSDHFRGLANAYDATTDWVRNPGLLQDIASLIVGPPVLDVACGTGLVARAVREEHPDWEILGIDLVASMCRHSVRRGIAAVAGDAEQLPFANASFGCVLCRQGLHYLDAARALCEWHRVLLPGGAVVLSQVVSENEDETAWWNDVKALLQPLRRTWYSVEGLRAVVERSGFGVSKQRRRRVWNRRPLSQFLAEAATPAARLSRALARWERDAPPSIEFRLEGDAVYFAQLWISLLLQPNLA